MQLLLSTNNFFFYFQKEKNRQCGFNIIMSKPILARTQISMFAKQHLLGKTCSYYTQRFFSAVKIENFIEKKKTFQLIFLLKTLIVGFCTF